MIDRSKAVRNTQQLQQSAWTTPLIYDIGNHCPNQLSILIYDITGGNIVKSFLEKICQIATTPLR